MSDKQKGLVKAIQNLHPNAESRHCVRHLYTNFNNQGGFKGKGLKDALWKVAIETTVKELNESMKALKIIKKKMLMTGCARTKIQSNGQGPISLQEVLNGVRDRPILTMFEGIRNILMKRLVKKRDEAEKYEGLLCPKIKKKLDVMVQQSVRCGCTAAGNAKYEVTSMVGHQHVVDIYNRTCSCRKWDLSGISCPHAVAVFRDIGHDAEQYVHNCYFKTTQLAITNCLINPVRGNFTVLNVLF